MSDTDTVDSQARKALEEMFATGTLNGVRVEVCTYDY
jgi:hypothetical protein